MSIPAFDGRGLLPPFRGDAHGRDRSPYWVDMTTIVSAFATTDRRKSLLRGFISYRQLLRHHGFDRGVQFVDGSFVENVEVIRGREPSDIDVFSLVHAPRNFLADPSSWVVQGLPIWNEEVQNAKKNKKRFNIDSYALLYEEVAGHPLGLINHIIYWYSLFSHQRDTFSWKGFVGVDMDLVASKEDQALAMLGTV
ncbi:MAG: hypothetical protein VX529_10615 [Pseudomonadota bacterium]|nr:hypothetical protein [Pseudomonadota bacterium]